ncbi:ATP-binding protein [Sphingomonas xanthus]|uniref:histidine kinase n=1 Tax=Sphingomonas xanthus TaxID=2594473 RepID=A0A516IU27_9SPHN|nr:ATP-binding protein [Sphingomonas xanthus]QDP20426.1 hypothetical protein FMM02_10955 [Sphingomonas xanthus]
MTAMAELRSWAQRASDKAAFFNLAKLFTLLLGYGILFTVLRAISSEWTTGQFYSLWFPAAGLRFAFLWHFGPKLAPAAALSELFIQLTTGENSLHPQPVLAVTGIVGPCLVYGAVIHLMRSGSRSTNSIFGWVPLPFAITAIISPIIACIATFPWSIPLALENGPLDHSKLASSLLVFSLGDMLGILMLSPPLLWMIQRLSGKRPARVKMPSVRLTLEVAIAITASLALTWGIYAADFGLLLSPVLLGACWAGLRTGRVGGWVCFAITALIVLPLTGEVATEADRIRHHMLLASIGAIGLLAGSFAEAQARLQEELSRRNRLLFRADRLKTLRAMSVAVIHEISQPLSTIALEAQGLAERKDDQDNSAETRTTVRLIASKAQDLSDMVRRLRSFGEKSSGNPLPTDILKLMDDVCVIAAPEAKAARVNLIVDRSGNGRVFGHDVELRQALLNLVRNAIAASPRGGKIWLRSKSADDRIRLSVENQISDQHVAGTGMGIGLIITRSIVEAHGGSVHEENLEFGLTRFTIDLPAHEHRNV